MQAQKALLRHLQKTFKASSHHCDSISVKINESRKSVETLINIQEQYVCCKKVDFSNSPYKEFPSLKDDLIYKLILASEEELQKLKSVIVDLSATYEKIQKQTDALFALYERYAEQLTVEDLTEGEPTRPSISAMMEFAQRIQQCFYVEYCKRKHLLRQISYDNPQTVTCLANEWTSVKGITEIMSDIIPWVKLFMTEDI